MAKIVMQKILVVVLVVSVQVLVHGTHGRILLDSSIAVAGGNQDAQEEVEANNTETDKAAQISKVTISVGEAQHNFLYTINGITYSPFRISVSGEYYNNQQFVQGGTRLFAGVDTGIYFYKFGRSANARAIQLYVQNFQLAEFFFEILLPYPAVSAFDLIVEQFNATAIVAYGPSRSTLQGGRKASA